MLKQHVLRLIDSDFCTGNFFREIKTKKCKSPQLPFGRQNEGKSDGFDTNYQRFIAMAR